MNPLVLTNMKKNGTAKPSPSSLSEYAGLNDKDCFLLNNLIHRKGKVKEAGELAANILTIDEVVNKMKKERL